MNAALNALIPSYVCDVAIRTDTVCSTVTYRLRHFGVRNATRACVTLLSCFKLNDVKDTCVNEQKRYA